MVNYLLASKRQGPHHNSEQEHAWVTLGGGLKEAIAVDPVWPLRTDIIQPSRGGLSRNHGTIRMWSLFDFISKALMFDQSGDFNAIDARQWTDRSRMKLLMDLATRAAMLMALQTAVNSGDAAPKKKVSCLLLDEEQSCSACPPNSAGDPMRTLCTTATLPAE